MSAETDRTARLLEALYPDELENSALGAEEVERLRAAIAADPEAQAQLAAWSAVRAAAARLPEREPDPQVHYDILRAARSAPHLEKKVSFFERLWAWSLNPAVAAVGLLIVAGSLFAVYSGREDTSADRFTPTAERPPTPGVAAEAPPEAPADQTARTAGEGQAQVASKKGAPAPLAARKAAEKPALDLAEQAAPGTLDGDPRGTLERAAGAAAAVVAEPTPPDLARPPAAPAEPPADPFAEEAPANLRAAAAGSVPARAPADVLDKQKVRPEPEAPEPAPEPEPAPATEAKVAELEAGAAAEGEAAGGDSEAAEPAAPPPPAQPPQVDFAPPPPKGPPLKKVGGLAQTRAPEAGPVSPSAARKSAPPSPARAPSAERTEARRSPAAPGKAGPVDDLATLDPFPAANAPAQPSAGGGRGAGGLGNGAPGGAEAGRGDAGRMEDSGPSGKAAAKGDGARSASDGASGALGGARAPAEPADDGAVVGAVTGALPAAATPAAPVAPAPPPVAAPATPAATEAATATPERAAALDEAEADATDAPLADDAPRAEDARLAKDTRRAEAEDTPSAADPPPAREAPPVAQGDSSRARRPATTAGTAAAPGLAEQVRALEAIIAAGGPPALRAAFEAAQLYERLGNRARARTLYAQVAAAPGPDAEAARARLKALEPTAD